MRSSGVVPAHVPASAVSVLASAAGPLTDGSATLTGGAATTGTVGAEKIAVAPPALECWTRTRRVAPMSAGPSSRLFALAPGTSEQFAPSASQRHHS